MLLTLPLLTFALAFDGLGRLRSKGDPRAALLAAAVCWGVLLTLMTELLSLFHALRLETVALGWGAAGLAALLATRRLKAPARPLPLSLPSASGGWGAPQAGLLGLPVVAVILVTGLTALLGWPNNSDSLVYHLSRVAHWTQNGSVAHYPTHIPGQLFLPPWAEYAILHVRLLSGDDRFGNLVQWFAMLGSLAGVSLIARRLGAGPRGQLFSALFCATLPMGILQASTTQNDYVAAFWLVALANALLAWQEQPASTGRRLEVGAALGLALLTKHTSYLYALPFLLLFLPNVVRRGAAGLKGIALVGMLALALNVPHLSRNSETYGSILGPPDQGARQYADSSGRLTNEAFSLPILISNLIRNASLHVGLPLPAYNSAVEGLITALHAQLGLDVNDPRTTWRNFTYVVLPPAPRENVAGNQVQMLLIVAAVAALALSRRLRMETGVWRFGLAIILCFALFSVLLKWQPPHSRLHLPLFVLWSPVVGCVFQHLNTRLLGGATLLMAVWTWPFLLDNRAHSLIGEDNVFTMARVDQTFSLSSVRQPEYVEAAEFLRSTGCSEVGLIVSWDDWEYPFWVLLPEAQAGYGRIEHVAVANQSGWLEARRPRFSPCAAVRLGLPALETVELGGRTYVNAWSSLHMQVYTVGT